MKLVQRIKPVVLEKGFILTFVIALFCLIFFFGKLLKNPNQVYFGSKLDGLQSYYTSWYHVKHDSTYWHFSGMNYPYGEQVFFTGCQPFVTNPLKLICHVIDISDYTIGILNFIMLISIFLSALCLYLIFKQLRLPFIYASIAATAIAFLSPQVIRLGAHYSLTYQFAIPLFLLLLLKFYQAPTLKKSFVISLLVFFMAGTHFYFFAFFGIIAMIYWATIFVSKISFKNLIFSVKHFFIQIVLPFLLFQFIIFLINDIYDRTTHPWGYLRFITNWDGIFYPLHFPFEHLFSTLYTPVFPETDEGYSYVGIVAILGCILIILEQVKRLLFLQFRKVLLITDNKMMNAFLWSSLIALLISFGYPFKIEGYEHWLNNLGMLQQLRGIARFVWIFYYVINIIVIYKLYDWTKTFHVAIKVSILIVPLFLLCRDAYYNTYQEQDWLNNPIPRLCDKGNQLPEDKWLTEINPSNYQAMFSLPYFHVGSENVWMTSLSHIIPDAYITSLQTGLPLLNVSMSRTSLSQTFKNIKIALEPYRKLEIVNDFKNNKPLLVLVEEKEINDGERKLLNHCKKIKQTPLFTVYELDMESLENISDDLYDKATENSKRGKRWKIENYVYTDSMKTFVTVDFDKNPAGNGFMEGGCMEAKVVDGCTLYEDTVPNFTIEQNYSVSFWMDNFTEDMYSRLWFVLETFDEGNNSITKSVYPMKDKFKIVEGKKALIENTVVVKHKKDKLKIYVSSYEIPDPKMIFRGDNLLVLPAKDTLYEVGEDYIRMNNRIYLTHLHNR